MAKTSIAQKLVLYAFLFLVLFQLQLVSSACSDVEIRNLTFKNFTIAYPTSINPTNDYDTNCSPFWYLVSNETFYESDINFSNNFEVGLNYTYLNFSSTNLLCRVTNLVNKEGTYSASTYCPDDSITSLTTSSPFIIGNEIYMGCVIGNSTNNPNKIALYYAQPGESYELITLSNGTDNNFCNNQSGILGYGVVDTSKFAGQLGRFYMWDLGTVWPWSWIAFDDVKVNPNQSKTILFLNSSVLSSAKTTISSYNQKSLQTYQARLPNDLTGANISGYGVGISRNTGKRYAYSPYSPLNKIDTYYNQYQTFLVYDNKVINPIISVFPSSDTVILEHYNATTGAYYAIANEPAYFFDESYNAWFILFPYTPLNTSLIYTSSVYLYNTSLDISLTSTLAPQPIYIICYEDNEIMKVKALFPFSVSHYLQAVNSTNVTTLYAGTGTFYEVNVSLSGWENMTYYANGYPLCSLPASTNTTIFIPNSFSINEVIQSDQLLSTIAKLLLIALFGIGIIIPYTIILAVMFADFTGLLTTWQAGVGVVAALMASAAINWQGERNIKTLIGFTVLGATIILVFIANPLTNPTGKTFTFNTALQSIMTDLQSIVSDTEVMNWFNPMEIIGISITAVIFIAKIIIFVLGLPVILAATLIELTVFLSPPIHAALSSFVSAITLAAYAYLAIKGYEIVQNRFRSV